MIQYIQCLKAREGMPILEFRECFGEYADKMRAIGKAVGATKVEASTTLVVADNLRVMSDRGTKAPYDAVLEVYLPNARVLEALETPEMRGQVEEFKVFQETFIDLQGSSFFFATVEED
jgi:hypothetical protein